MSTSAPVSINIVNGPSASDVLDAFKYAYARNAGVRNGLRPLFELELNDPSIALHTMVPKNQRTRTTAQVIGVEYESGSPGMFIIKMNILNGTYLAFYNANTRKGSLIEKL